VSKTDDAVPRLVLPAMMNESSRSNKVTDSQTGLTSTSAFATFGMFSAATEYMVDAAQRSVLFWDVMRRRGNQYREHLAETAPHVLDYEVELLIDGRTLDRPVNYGLVRVVAPPGVELDPTRRPFVIIDPRAGHGPRIGGFKADSEIGVAFKAADGKPCVVGNCQAGWAIMMLAAIGPCGNLRPSYWVIGVYMLLYENFNSRRAGALAVH
jgi:hypothetical protein